MTDEKTFRAAIERASKQHRRLPLRIRQLSGIRLPSEPGYPTEESGTTPCQHCDGTGYAYAHEQPAEYREKLERIERARRELADAEAEMKK